MNDAHKKGLALLIMGVIVALGATMDIVYFWYIGLVLGIIGTILMFSETKEYLLTNCNSKLQ